MKHHSLLGYDGPQSEMYLIPEIFLSYQRQIPCLGRRGLSVREFRIYRSAGASGQGIIAGGDDLEGAILVECRAVR